jgi:hypothetical protein
MPKFDDKKAWERFVDQGIASGKTPQEMNALSGLYVGPEGRFKVHQARKSKRGWTAVDADKRDKRDAKRVEMERVQSLGVGDTVEPRGTNNTSLRNELGATKGLEIHHRISLIQNTPFFDGLSEKEQREFVTWANKNGWNLGNQPGNPEIVIPKGEHTRTHGWLRENGIEGTKHQNKLIKKIQGMSMDDRKFAFRNYMEYVQGGADEFMLDYLGPKSVSPSHADAQQRNRDFLARDTQVENLRNSVGNIETGPRAGQRLPINRRTLGNSIIKDLQVPKSAVRAAGVLPAVSLITGFGQAGHAASKGDIPGAIAHGVGAVVGEVPIFGDVINESVTGTSVADATIKGQNRRELQTPALGGKQGPAVPTQRQSQAAARAKVIREDPSQERGYETIQKVWNEGSRMVGGWLKQLGIK